jgi:uncharacterized protein
MKHQNSCLLLFVKYPTKGKVKLRLSKDLNEEIAQELYQCFILDTLVMIEKMNLPFFICVTPPNKKNEFQRWLGSSYQYLTQKGSDLGGRMKNSFKEVFTKGVQNAVLIGSDSPDLPKDYIKQAFSTLESKDVVLGPTYDGGYYLIGFKATTFTPSVFEDILWSSPMVFQQTVTKIQHAKRSIGLLPTWSDVDTISDLRNLVDRSKDTSFKSSETMTYLRHHRITWENTHE